MNTDNNNQLLILNGRKRLEITEVTNVVSFDDDYLELSTGSGELAVEGAELKIEELSQEKRKILITGRINAVIYKEQKHCKKKKEK